MSSTHPPGHPRRFQCSRRSKNWHTGREDYPQGVCFRTCLLDIYFSQAASYVHPQGCEAADTFSVYSINTRMQIFYSEKLIKISDMMKKWSHHVFHSNFSSFLSALTFSCEMRMDKLRFFVKENNNNSYLILCNVVYDE